MTNVSLRIRLTFPLSLKNPNTNQTANKIYYVEKLSTKKSHGADSDPDPLLLPFEESEPLRAELQLRQASLCLVSPSERSRKQRAAHGRSAGSGEETWR